MADSSTANPFAAFERLPKSTLQEATSIEGNVPLSEKQLNLNVWAYLTSTEGRFANSVAACVNIKRIDIVKRDSSELECEVVCEIEVNKEMTNAYGTMHGACGALLVDSCTTSALFCLGLNIGKDLSGVSQTMNIIYHSAPRLGTILTVVCTTMASQGRLQVARCEMRDKKTERLVVSGIHTKVNPGAKVSLSPNSKL